MATETETETAFNTLMVGGRIYGFIESAGTRTVGRPLLDGQWAMRLQAQAQAAGVPFFYKAGLLNGKRYIETP